MRASRNYHILVPFVALALLLSVWGCAMGDDGDGPSWWGDEKSDLLVSNDTDCDLSIYLDGTFQAWMFDNSSIVLGDIPEGDHLAVAVPERARSLGADGSFHFYAEEGEDNFWTIYTCR